MRILAGSLGGRPFDQPKTTAVRPLSDKVRGAIFDMLGDIEGLVVLDVYAGSGAAGFEAASRGASLVEAIEASQPVARVIESNARSLGLDWGYVLHVLNVETWLALPSNQPAPDGRLTRYDIIIADPPYVRIDADIMGRLARLLNTGGVLVVSHSSKSPSPMLESGELVRQKTYGDTALSIYKSGS